MTYTSPTNPDESAEADALRDLVAWYQAMGVDCAVDDEAHDRLNTPEPRTSPSTRHHTPNMASTAAGQQPSTPPSYMTYTSGEQAASEQASTDEAVTDARAQALAAPDLAALRAALEAFEGCSLRRGAQTTVFADGNPKARIMLVGEAPGADEDRQGRPFVGRSGQLLDRMLAAIGLDRTQVYIANIVPWRPPANRKPSPEERAICRPFIERHVELVAPEFLVLLGGVSASEFLGTTVGITRLRGQWHSIRSGDRTIKALPMLHPASLLRSPLQKRDAWADMLTLKRALEAPLSA